MSTKALTLTVPASLARELDALGTQLLSEILQRGLRAWRIEKALDRYAGGDISFGAAAEQAGVSQGELARHAYARGMEPPFSSRSLAEGLS